MGFLLLLTGCQHTGAERKKSALGVISTDAENISAHRKEALILPIPRNSFNPSHSHKKLGDYAEQMTMELLSKTRDIDLDSKIAIASFVEFNHDLKTTSILGNQLAESFIPELQSYGLSIVDFKATSSITVAPEGDLFFERSGPRGAVQFVLSGTLKCSNAGVEVSARIINIHDKVVVASATGFIPHFVVSSLSPDYFLHEFN